MMTTHFEAVWPGMRQTMLREAKGTPITFEQDFDKITVRSGEHSIGIPLDAIRIAVEHDAYDTLENAAKNAVMYLRVLTNRNTKKYRAFRTKRRGILAARRMKP